MSDNASGPLRLRPIAILILVLIGGGLRLFYALYFNYGVGVGLISPEKMHVNDGTYFLSPSTLCLFLAVVLAFLDWSCSEPGKTTGRSGMVLLFCMTLGGLLWLVWPPVTYAKRQAKVTEELVDFGRLVRTNAMSLANGEASVRMQAIFKQQATLELPADRPALEAKGRWVVEVFDLISKYLRARNDFRPDAYLFHGDIKTVDQIENRIGNIREFSAAGRAFSAGLKPEGLRSELEKAGVSGPTIEKISASSRDDIGPIMTNFDAAIFPELAVASNTVKILELSKAQFGHWTAKPDEHDPHFEDAESARLFETLSDSEIDLENTMYLMEQRLGKETRLADPRPVARRAKRRASVSGPSSVSSSMVTITPLTQADGRFISAVGRVDMVHDVLRQTLYITEGPNVLRYHLGSNTFLAPLALGGDLRGIDISPDGAWLAVADGVVSGAEATVHIVNLNTKATERSHFACSGGAHAVVFGSDGAVYMTSTAGWGPLFRYDPATRKTSEFSMPNNRKLSARTMLAVTADRGTIAYAQGDNSAGDFGKFDITSKAFIPAKGTGAFNYEVGISRDGAQLVVPVYSGTVVPGGKPATLGNAIAHPIGVAFHPTRDVVFFSWMGSSCVRAFKTSDYSQIAEFQTGQAFENPGNHAFVQGRLRISNDGALLFCTVDGGVRCFETKMGENAGEKRNVQPPPPASPSIEIRRVSTSAR